MTGRRVAVTGIGVVSALGSNMAEFRESLRSCSSGIRLCRAGSNVWSPEMQSDAAGYLAAPAAKPRDLSGVGANLDPFAAFAVIAAREAVRDAGADVLAFPHRTAVILGTAVGGDQSRDVASYRALRTQQRPHPLTIVRAMSNAAVSAVTMDFGLTGPAFTISSACASGTHAIGEAFRMVRHGYCDVALAGGSESLPSISLFKSWRQMGVMSPDGCRPFAADRLGIVLGEGAGVLVLEPLEGAVDRGARIYCEVAGYGSCADAGDWVHPRPEGMTRCMREALTDAAVPPADIGYVNAHGTGTQLGDGAEAEALNTVFGATRAGGVPVSSTKALHGHALGASGALEAAATALALAEGWVPPMPVTIPDPHLCLNLVLGEARPLVGDTALSCSFSFGGLNSSLVLRRVTGNNVKYGRTWI